MTIKINRLLLLLVLLSLTLRTEAAPQRTQKSGLANGIRKWSKKYFGGRNRHQRDVRSSERNSFRRSIESFPLVIKDKNIESPRPSLKEIEASLEVRSDGGRSIVLTMNYPGLRLRKESLVREIPNGGGIDLLLIFENSSAHTKQESHVTIPLASLKQNHIKSFPIYVSHVDSSKQFSPIKTRQNQPLEFHLGTVEVPPKAELVLTN